MPVRRMPHNRNHVCWARIPQDSGGVLYRLYRRDQRGVLHCFMLTYTAEILADDPAVRLGIACEIRRARRALRDPDPEPLPEGVDIDFPVTRRADVK